MTDVTAQRQPDDSIDYYVLDVALLPDLPERSIAVCVERYLEAGPHFRLALEKAAHDEKMTEAMATGLFRGLHIMGGVRDTQAFGPLLRLLSRPSEDLEWLLGDAITETVPRILIGTFNGNADALFDAIADRERDEIVRDGLLRAATFLTWEGRVDRSRMIAFLERFGSGELAVELEFVWHAWVDAIAVLGLRELEPLVTEALAKGLVDEFIFERDDFYEWLERAERDPADGSRFADSKIGYLDDVLDALRRFSDDDVEDDENGVDLLNSDEDVAIQQPVVNPWRHVGRNDPCPCGSGKKAKRCCLAA